ncbi:DUF3616 domain-containing protein [Dactylosporangium sp. McL0621]|uniref:DUF3616 domain-containing protein n=1 Tax=Dactylosporangium sp. McL0621 TaxID=3415678 RepID=UPI003CFA8CAA
MTVDQTVRLYLGERSRAATTHTNLSAVRADGPVLWVAGDETATVERLVADDPGDPRRYDGETSFRLADLVPLPGVDADEEADIEGLARTGPFLWAIGSHSLRRKQIKSHHDGPKPLKRLARVEGQANRQVLIRLPIADVAGLPAPVPYVETDGGPQHAAILSGEDNLRNLLSDDPHLAPFLPIPGKDNGLDIEGIAVHGERVYLGLRGPVLRGWAVVLELRPYADPDDPRRLRLRPFEDGRRYRKHVLALGGLGIRDMCPDGGDLLLLTGPSMDLDGPVRLYRWHHAAVAAAPQVVRGDAVRLELDLPYGEGDDHAEGITLVGPPEHRRLLVVYDSPAPGRLAGDGAVLADLVKLP